MKGTSITCSNRTDDDLLAKVIDLSVDNLVRQLQYQHNKVNRVKGPGDQTIKKSLILPLSYYIE